MRARVAHLQPVHYCLFAGLVAQVRRNVRGSATPDQTNSVFRDHAEGLVDDTGYEPFKADQRMKLFKELRRPLFVAQADKVRAACAPC